jgi:hypothetical protein
MALPTVPGPAKVNKTAEMAITIGFLSTRIILSPYFFGWQWNTIAVFYRAMPGHRHPAGAGPRKIGMNQLR